MVKRVVYVDTLLPFGLCSAPKIFTAMADALLWIISQHGVQNGLHYLDDFLFIDAPTTWNAQRPCNQPWIPVLNSEFQWPLIR